MNFVTQSDIKHGKVLRKLNSLKITDFKEFDLSKVLFVESWNAICRQKTTSFYILKRLLKKPKKIILERNNPNILCVYTYNYRNDHDNYWKKIVSDVGPCDSITLMNYPLLNFRSFVGFFNFVGRVLTFLKYRHSLRCFDTSVARYLAVQLVNRKWVLDRVKKMKLKPQATMCFFDSSPDENLLMLYFKEQGSITITNQHGYCVFRSKEYDRVNQSQLLNFKCDYFFAKGQFQVNQFEKAGIDLSKIKLVGVPIEQKRDDEALRSLNKGSFVVFLDCPSLPFADETNNELILIAERVSDMTGFSFYLKPHPSETIDKLKLYSNNLKHCVGVFEGKSTLDSCFKLADFALVSASAVYVDSYFFGIRPFKYVSSFPFDIAQNNDCFHDSDELITKIKQWLDLNNAEQKKYIDEVKKIYDCGWKDGVFNRTIKKLIIEKHK